MLNLNEILNSPQDITQISNTSDGYLPYSDKVINSDTSTTYGGNGVTTQKIYEYNYPQALNEAQKYSETITKPLLQSNDDYVSAMQDLYKRFTPPDIENAKEDTRYSGITMLAQAFNDLGKALGKSFGNDDGLGMVTVDKDSNFQNLYNNALKNFQNFRNAQNKENEMIYKNQAELLKEKYKQKQEADKLTKDFFKKYLKDNAKVTEIKTGTQTKQTVTNKQENINPNSQEWKDKQFDKDYKRQTLDFRRQNTELKRKDIRLKTKELEDKQAIINPLSNNKYFVPREDDDIGTILKEDRDYDVFTDLSPQVQRELYATVFSDKRARELVSEYESNGWIKPFKYATTLPEMREQLNQIGIMARSGDWTAYEVFVLKGMNNKTVHKELGWDEPTSKLDYKDKR